MCEPASAAFAPEAPSNVSATQCDLNLAGSRNARNFAELSAHWHKLQDFLEHWGSQQEKFLRCDSACASLDDVQIQLEDPIALQIDHPREVTNGMTTTGCVETWRVKKAPHDIFGSMQNEDASGQDNDEHQPTESMNEAENDPSDISDGTSQASVIRGDVMATVSLGQWHASGRGSLISQTIGDLTENRVVKKRHFDISCGVVIFANVIVTGLDADYAMQNPMQEPPVFFEHCETFFLVFYTLEVVLRMCGHGREYFTGSERTWNMFDMALVIQGMSERVHLAATRAADAGLGGNFAFLRLLRLMKLLKLLRMVRLLRMFRELRLILGSIIACLPSMLWTGILILAVTYLFGIAFMQACTGYLRLDVNNRDPDVSERIKKYYGSVLTSILSLYMASLGGQDWELIAEPLARVGGVYYCLFLVYIAIFAFVVMNIVSSIFLESILKHADGDLQLAIEAHMEQKQDYIDRLQQLYELLDENASGEISYKQFRAQADSKEMQAFAAILQIDTADVSKLFLEISDRGRRTVDMETFVVGCIKSKGAAKNVDLMGVNYTQKKSSAALQKTTLELHEMVVVQQKSSLELHEMVTNQNATSLELHEMVTKQNAMCQDVLRTLAEYGHKQIMGPDERVHSTTVQNESLRARFHLQL